MCVCVCVKTWKFPKQVTYFCQVQPVSVVARVSLMSVLQMAIKIGAVYVLGTLAVLGQEFVGR